MSKPVNLHAGDGIIVTDPSLGILIAYGSTVPVTATIGYAPGCMFIKTTASSIAAAIYFNNGTKASSAFAGNLVTTATTQTLTNKTLSGPSVAVTGGLTSSGPTGTGIGYATGAGAAVAQATDRTTGVTLNNLCGKITTQATSLTAQTSVAFTLTNSTIALGDVVVVSVQSGPTGLKTIATVTTIAAGSCQINLFNTDASVADTGAAILNFAVIKAVAA